MIIALGAALALALTARLAYKLGQYRMARDAMVVMHLIESGEAHVAEDGSVRMSDSDYIEDQREMAAWQ